MFAFSSPAAIQDGRLRRLLQMMEDDPRSTVDDWARTFHLSCSYLSHLFKQATGASLGQVLHEQRMQRAAHLLATSNLSVKEIAIAVGYEHTSSFTRAFERRFERGPRSYRRKIEGG
ncbi:MAG TPA: helix-turn-helix transcriptional regulator [Thermoanaerobaculia bacterium]|jgi:AraC-like DNA-binding protein|nr:helix-turn-helix transcriptional regulator [Thermoanaerobaculia bacterium]